LNCGAVALRTKISGNLVLACASLIREIFKNYFKIV